MPLFTFPNQSKARICVIADMILGHYIYGSFERLSPEAPVQIVDVKEMLTVWALRANSNR